MKKCAVISALLLLLVDGKSLPKRFPQPCSKSTPNYRDCMRDFFGKLGPHLVQGVRKLSFPKLMPLDVPLVVIERKASRGVSFEGRVTNMRFWGYETGQIEAFDIDPEKMSGRLRLGFSYFPGEFDYNTTGRVLGVSLTNIGHFRSNFSGCELDITYKMKPEDRMGKTYLTFEKFYVHGTMGDGPLMIVSKDPRQQPIADAVMLFFNRNGKLLAEACQPVFDDILSALYKAIVEQVFNRVPMNELLPE